MPVEAMSTCYNAVRFGFRSVAILETVGTKTVNLSCCSVHCCVESDTVVGTGA